MQVVNKKMCVIVILVLVIIESCTLFLMYKSYGNKNNTLDEVNLNISNSNMFAIMLEQDDGTYKEDTTSTWPTSGYTYNASMSGCIDINGNRIEDALTYDKENNKASVNTTNTSYCYLYFSLLPYAAQKAEMWESTLEGDGYRYVGTNPNNYICFGTTDKATCTGNTDLYMYRIIGIFEDTEGNEHLKLIKKESLETEFNWHVDFSCVDWDESELYYMINGNHFLKKTTYSYMQDNAWADKIVDWDYTATNTLTNENYSSNNVYGLYYNYNTPKSIYLHELNRSAKSEQTCYYNANTIADCNVGEWKTVNAKIGLMYVSDYALSLGTETLNLVIYSNYKKMKTSWMYLNNNDNDAPSNTEWTMSLFGSNESGDCCAESVDVDGYISNYWILSAFSVRPVFYLTSNVKIIGGTGTIDDPFIIS